MQKYQKLRKKFLLLLIVIIKEKELVNKSKISRLINYSDLDKKDSILSNQSRIRSIDLSLFIGQSYFGNDGLQNFLTFQQIYKTFKMPVGLTAGRIARRMEI